MTLKTTIKEYNNKTRKGTYVYIKETGKPSRTYKYTKGKTNIKALQAYYTEKYVKENQNVIFPVQRKGHKRSIKELQTIKAPPISKLLKKGIAATIIQNARTANQQNINQAKRRLVGKLIEKPEYLSLMIKKENLEKIKHRLTYDIEYKDAQGKTLITSKEYDKTPEQVINTLQKSTETTTRVDAKEHYDIISKYLIKNGMKQTKNHNNGTVNKIKLTITIIKGK